EEWGVVRLAGRRRLPGTARTWEAPGAQAAWQLNGSSISVRGPGRRIASLVCRRVHPVWLLGLGGQELITFDRNPKSELWTDFLWNYPADPTVTANGRALGERNLRRQCEGELDGVAFGRSHVRGEESALRTHIL